MLIEPSRITHILNKFNIKIKGVLHVGAHECEELACYMNHFHLYPADIVWVDANPKLIEKNKEQGIPNCFTAVLDETERSTNFNITNNGESSSILEFGTHATSYSNIVVVETFPVQTQTLTQFFKRNFLDPTKYNFWNFDIQGVEVQVLRGSKELLQHADVIYSEINTGEVYKGCGKLDEMDALLGEHGFRRVITEFTVASWGDAIYVRYNK